MLVFYGNLISPIKLDTSSRGRSNIRIEISPPPGRKKHIRSTVANVIVYSNYEPGNAKLNRKTDTIGNILFKYHGEKPFVHNKTLSDKIHLLRNQYTSKDDVQLTYRGLGDLGVYKFVNIDQEVRSSDSSKIDYTIKLTPNKKWAFDTGLDFNYSTIRSETPGNNLFGLTGSASLLHRNLFRRAVSLKLSAEVGAEINLSQIDSFNTISINTDALMKIPRFVDLPGTLSFLSLIKVGKKHLINPSFYKKMRDEASTDIQLQYQNVFVTDFYKYISLNLSYGHELIRGTRTRYTLHSIGINYYRPDSLSRFDDITNSAQFVQKTFLGNRLFTGFLYRDFSFYYQSQPNVNGRFWIFNASNEVSGLEIWAINSVYNSITNKSGKFTLKLDEEIDFARYTRFDFQYRYYIPFARSRSVAIRIAPAVAFSLDSLEIPYVKQYAVGGPQSVRAWQLRQIGPGGTNVVVNDGQPYFSAGDIKLEFNIEYRFDLFWKLKSAFFIDAGNVWTIGAGNSESNFTGEFYKELAIGAGTGLRLDATFVLFRFDIGAKIKNHFRDKDSGSYWHYNSSNALSLPNAFKSLNYNLAIGYPF